MKKSRKTGKKKRKMSKISDPLQVTHVLHLDNDLNWTIDKNVDPNEIFVKIKEIGQGGFGTVMQLMHKPSSTLLAGKSILSDLVTAKTRDMLNKEIDLMRQIVSDYTIHYYGTITFQGSMTILMEFCELGSIRDLIDYRNQVLTEPQISIVMHDLLQALRILHEKHHIVHRDIKAANILLSSNGYCRVTDFGVSRQFQEGAATFSTSTMVGTPYWMAPEVINEDKYSFSADVWSAAATAIEIAEGAPPYVQLPSTKAMVEIATHGFPPLRFADSFSDDFIDFISVCTNVDPKKRPSVEQLLKHPFVAKANVDYETRLKVMEPLLHTQMDFTKLLEMVNEADDDDEFERTTKSFIQESKSKIRDKSKK